MIPKINNSLTRIRFILLSKIIIVKKLEKALTLKNFLQLALFENQ